MSMLNTIYDQVEDDNKIRPFTPTITDINSYGFTINAEAFSSVGEIVSYTYILDGEIIQSSNDKKCIVSLLEANKEYTVTVIATDNLENSRDSITVKPKTKNEIRFTKEYLEQGTFLGNTKVTQNNYNGSAGLSMTGNSNRPTSVKYDLNDTYTHIRWDKEIDLTNYNTLSFYAKKGANHGGFAIYLDKSIAVFARNYSNASSNWTLFTVDLPDGYEGVHTISFIGGYNDNTGSTSSNSQYCDIKLYAK